MAVEALRPYATGAPRIAFVSNVDGNRLPDALATAVPAHFAAVSVNATAMDAFGVNRNYRFAMWDWVGGKGIA